MYERVLPALFSMIGVEEESKVSVSLQCGKLVEKDDILYSTGLSATNASE